MLLCLWCTAAVRVSLRKLSTSEQHWSVNYSVSQSVCLTVDLAQSQQVGESTKEESTFLPSLKLQLPVHVSNLLRLSCVQGPQTSGCPSAWYPGLLAVCRARGTLLSEMGVRAKRHGQPPWRRGRNKCEMIYGRNLMGIEGEVKGEAAMRTAGELKRVQVGLGEM